MMFKLLKLGSNINIFVKRNVSNGSKLRIIDILSKKENNDEVIVEGWVKAIRKQKENVFVDLSDGSCSERLQILVPAKEKSSDLSTGASISVNGRLGSTPKGQIELIAKNVTIIGNCTIADGYPFAPRKTYSQDYIRQFLHFRPRTNKFSSVLRVRHTVTKAINDYFHQQGFFQIHTPVLTSNDCEGAGEVFSVIPDNKSLLKDMIKKGQMESEAYFNSKTFLTVSGQLHLEAVAHGLSKVYCFGPTFRAENSKSRLHLSEFYMIEAEIAFVNNLQHIISFVEGLLKTTTKSILNNSNNSNIKEIDEDNLKWLHKPFVILTYDEAINVLENNKSKLTVGVNKFNGLTKEHELFLVNHCDGSLVCVTNWPKELKSFYMKQNPDDLSKVFAFDLLAPIVGEIIGGSLREDNYELLKEKLPSDDLNWYLELRKFGGVPTGGFGLGFERFLQLILGVNNIKDTIPFPRWPHNCSL